MTAIIARPATGATQAPSPAAAQPQPGEASTSPTLIVLSLRPDGSKFNGNRIGRAQEAGFDWLKNAHQIGLSDPDTGNEVARHVVNNSDEAFGRLKEIQVHIDPEQCALLLMAGEYLVPRLKKFAVLVGGHICDSMGQPLDNDAVDAIAEHINAVMKKRFDAKRKARTVTMPDGEVRILSELSFAYAVIREAGSKKRCYRSVWFDVPALHYYEGRALGMQMANEVVQFYRTHKTMRISLIDIMREAMLANQYVNYDKASAGNVASGFIEVLGTLVRIGAAALNPAWLSQKIMLENQNHTDWKKDREDRKTEFVKRMKEARQKKAGAA